MFNTPKEIFDAFNNVKPVPVPLNVPFVNVAALLNTRDPLPVDVVTPVPPCKILNVPEVIFVAFNAVKPFPLPLKVPLVIVAALLNTTDPEPVDVFVPVPPWETFNVPNVIFDAFNVVKPVPMPLNVPLVIVAALLNTSEPLPVDVVTPVPPLATFNVPNVILVAFNVVKPVPTPLNVPLVIVAALLNTSDPLPIDVVTPVPPRATSNVPLEILEAFNAVKPVPTPLNVPLVIVAALLNTSDPLPVDVVTPVPPRATFNVPNEIFDAFNAVKPVPVPLKVPFVIVAALLNTTEPFPDDVVTPVPPCKTVKIPVFIFAAFKDVKPDPEPKKLVALKVLEVLFQDKFTVWSKALDPFPINICPDVNVVVPIPPRETVNIPVFIFEAFKDVKPKPEPWKLVALKVFKLLSQVKFVDCNNAALPFPINNWFVFKDVLPVPP